MGLRVVVTPADSSAPRADDEYLVRWNPDPVGLVVASSIDLGYVNAVNLQEGMLLSGRLAIPYALPLAAFDLAMSFKATSTHEVATAAAIAQTRLALTGELPSASAISLVLAVNGAGMALFLASTLAARAGVQYPSHGVAGSILFVQARLRGDLGTESSIASSMGFRSTLVLASTLAIAHHLQGSLTVSTDVAGRLAIPDLLVAGEAAIQLDTVRISGVLVLAGSVSPSHLSLVGGAALTSANSLAGMLRVQGLPVMATELGIAAPLVGLRGTLTLATSAVVTSLVLAQAAPGLGLASALPGRLAASFVNQQLDGLFSLNGPSVVALSGVLTLASSSVQVALVVVFNPVVAGFLVGGTLRVAFATPIPFVSGILAGAFGLSGVLTVATTVAGALAAAFTGNQVAAAFLIGGTPNAVYGLGCGATMVGPTAIRLVGALGLGGMLVSKWVATWINPGTFTWTAPPGITSVFAECWSGGGGGGAGVVAGGGGGGGGSYFSGTVVVTPGNSYFINVGAGGVGGTPTTAAEEGGFSAFNSSSVVAQGGGLGSPGLVAQGAGGAGSAGGTGSASHSGGNGGGGALLATNGGGGGGGAGSGQNGQSGNSNGNAGNGGNPDGGDGGAGATAVLTAGNAAEPGGGGGGGSTALTNGGAGGKGKVRLTWVVS